MFASKAGWAVVYVVFGSILVSAIFLRTMDMGNMIADWASLIRAVVILIGTFTLGSLSLRLLSSVSREREQQTLTTLLTLPIVPKHLLFAKWTGTLFRSRAALIGVILAFITIGIAGSIDVHAWCLLPLAYAAHLCFFGNLALLLSVLCRSTTVAYILFAAIVAVLIGGAWMISILEPTPPRPPGLPPAWTGTDDEWEEHRPATTNDWLNPPQTWWRLTAHSRVAMPYKYANPLRKTEFDLPGTDWFGWRRIALAALGFMTVGVLFWWLATRIFRRQQVR